MFGFGFWAKKVKGRDLALWVIRIKVCVYQYNTLLAGGLINFCYYMFQSITCFVLFYKWKLDMQSMWTSLGLTFFAPQKSQNTHHPSPIYVIFFPFFYFFSIFNWTGHELDHQTFLQEFGVGIWTRLVKNKEKSTKFRTLAKSTA